MNRLKTDMLDTCEAGLAGKRALDETMQHMKENWPDRRQANMVLRQLDAVAKCMEKQSTTMACKIGMAYALKHHMKMQCQRHAEVAQTPLRQVTNFISGSTSASATKKRALSPSMSETARDIVPNALQFTSPRELRPRPLHEKPHPDVCKRYTARAAVKYMWYLYQQDPKLNVGKVADE